MATDEVKEGSFCQGYDEGKLYWPGEHGKVPVIAFPWTNQHNNERLSIRIPQSMEARARQGRTGRGRP